MEAGRPLYQHPLFQRIAGETWRPGGTALTRHGLALCGFSPGQRILDIGCGVGASMAVLANSGLCAVGLDREYRLTGPFSFVRADAGAPPFARCSFDGLLCECVLSLLPEPEIALRRFAAILRPGGRLLLTDLYLRDVPVASPVQPSPSVPNASCLSGTRSCGDMDSLLQRAGLRIRYFEDHSAALKELAARLLWYGGDTLNPA
ncbi:MAG: methyltransferase domain-containing protein, partial [Desulfovibrionaceae bacterium]|nr:methyltransferase domain-containing protein [Desulfovibrionaceae bacterium]